MLAINILKHAFLQVFGNMRQVVNISLLPLLIQFFGTIAVAVMTLQTTGDASFFMSLLLAVFLLLPFVWIAVTWHRFVLLNDPQPILPQLPMTAVLRYIGTAVLVGILLLVPLLVAALLSQVMVQMLGSAGVIVTLLVGLIAVLAFMVISLRLSVALPAAAIGAPDAITTAWKATAGHTGTFLLLSILMALPQIPLNMIALVQTGPEASVVIDILLMLLIIAATWIYTFVTLSVLTTLYGYFVEKRLLRTAL